MKFYDAFSGVGGFHCGIKQAHPDWECSGACEINPHAASVYKKHFNEVKIDGDIRKVDRLPEGIDILCGGFPCQSFSIAGKRGGFDDTRGTLFFELARLAKASRPRLLFFENVKGLLNHDEGKTFATIIQAMEELGYLVEWEVLNSKNFGVPQNRERVFIVGHLGGERGCEIFPLGEGDGVPDEACS
jgi:DNA (cytosine-5)-methyltransferase 1